MMHFMVKTMSRIDINEIIGVDDNVRFKVFQNNEYLGEAYLKNGHLYSVYGFSLDTVQIEIILNRAEYDFVICSER